MVAKAEVRQERTKNRGKITGRNRRKRKGIAGIPGNPVTALREEMGLNMKQFAILLRMPYFTLQTLERGEVKTLTPEIMEVLEKAGISDDAPWKYEEWRADAAKKSAA